MVQVGLAAPAALDSVSVQALVSGIQVAAASLLEGPGNLTETLTFVVPALSPWQINSSASGDGTAAIGNCHVQTLALSS